MDEDSLLQVDDIAKYVHELQCFPFKEMFSRSWVVQACRVLQLNVQTALEMNKKMHENVRLILVEQKKFQSEVAAISLLENLCFDENLVEDLEILSLDLIDFCVQRLTQFISAIQDGDIIFGPKNDKTLNKLRTEFESDQLEDSVWSEINHEEHRTEFVVATRSIALLQVIICSRSRLPLCAATRVIMTHDVPQLLCAIIQCEPWKVSHDDFVYIFNDGQWTAEPDGPPRLHRLEIQCLVTLQSLLMDRDTSSMYELTNGRRAALMKLRTRFDDVAFSEVPSLEPFFRWLAMLELLGPQEPRKPPLVTTLTQLSDALTDNWSELADQLKHRVLTPSAEALQLLASHMSSAWDIDALEMLLPDIACCAKCGAAAGRRCGRCRSQWYCRRECQVQHWNDHKILCNLISNNFRNNNSKVIK